jgi:ribokinase
MIDIITVGWITIDDIVLPDATCRKQVIGGGALYSALGARIWCDRVGIHSVIGEKYIDLVTSEISQRDLDVTGLTAIRGSGLELWLLHESETSKQQVPKLTSSTAEEMDNGRGPLPDSYRAARGFHIAPQTPRGSLENLSLLSTLPSHPLITLDILADTYVDADQYRELVFLNAVTCFLPSKEEVERIWHPKSLGDWMKRLATRHACCLAVKMGADGSLVCNAPNLRIYKVPAFPSGVVDTTGAGDSYCGGFLAGLVGNRPILECAVMGTVSASFTVETSGALSLKKPSDSERDERFQSVLRRVTEYRL